MVRAVIYARVSRDDTGEGRSVERQVDACRKLADLRGWTVVATEIDNSISAWSGKNRPAWERVLHMVDAGEVDAIVAWQVDRMTRSMLDLEGLIALAEGRGIIVAATSGDLDLTNESGRMTARILAAVARQEVERKAARQRLANEARAREGKPHSGGARPFGYAPDYVTVVEEEAELIRDGARQALAGVPLVSIARQWSESGFASSRNPDDGAGWTAHGVRTVMLNPRYAGIRMYRGERVAQAAWSAILDEETHLALVAKLEEPSRRRGNVKTGRKPANLLTGIARCGVCGSTVKGSGDSRNGRLAYSCSARHCIFVPRAVTDLRVAGWVVALLSQPGIIEALATNSNSEDGQIRADVSDARARLAELEDDFADGGIDYATLKRLRVRLEARIAAGEEQLAQSARGGALASVVGVDDVAARWESLPLERQRVIVDAVADVRLMRATRPFDPERCVRIEVKEA